MSPDCDDPLQDWISLYSEETKCIWDKENKELRRACMLMNALIKEFKRIEDNLNSKVGDYRQQINANEDLKETRLKDERADTSLEEVPVVNKSPKLNKRRKNLQLKKIISLPKSSNLCVPTASKLRLSSEDLFECSLSGTSLEDSFDNDESNFKLNPHLKRKVTNDVVENSFLIEQTPDKTVVKKLKLDKNLSSRKSKSKVDKLNTLTQMLVPSEILNRTGSKNITQEKKSLTIKDQRQTESKQDIVKEEFLAPPSFLKDYDRIPVVEDKQPQHVHKTETVRRKVDRLKLPGWSCAECKAYYEGSDLSSEELRKKMNICSKHRNRFAPSNDTIAGFWDVEMPDTQETQDDMTVVDLDFIT